MDQRVEHEEAGEHQEEVVDDESDEEHHDGFMDGGDGMQRDGCEDWVGLLEEGR